MTCLVSRSEEARETGRDSWQCCVQHLLLIFLNNADAKDANSGIISSVFPQSAYSATHEMNLTYIVWD